MENITSCLITNKPISRLIINNDCIQYSVVINNEETTLLFCTKCFSQPETLARLKDNRELFYSFLLNKKGFVRENKERPELQHHPFYKQIIHGGDLKATIEQQTYPLTPDEKIDNLFIGLSNMQKHAGERVSLDIRLEEVYLKYYFKNDKEIFFYLNALANDEQLVLYVNYTPLHFELTYKGLLKAIHLQEEGLNSNRCFVAMSFDVDDTPLFDDAILPACKKYGFEAIRVDRQQASNEQTINDLIIAEIKKSRFLISDFTKQKNGVYFEAGYGLGRGKKVIYTCRKDHKDTLHFDVNHFPVLFYETIDELKEMLENKIEAFILD